MGALDPKESEIYTSVLSFVAAKRPVREAWNAIKTLYGQNPFEGRTARDRKANFEKLYENFTKYPASARLAVLTARRKEFVADLVQAAMSCDVPAEDVEDYAQAFKRAENYPGSIPDALELMAEFDAPRAKALLERARGLWNELQVKESEDAEKAV